MIDPLALPVLFEGHQELFIICTTLSAVMPLGMDTCLILFSS